MDHVAVQAGKMDGLARGPRPGLLGYGVEPGETPPGDTCIAIATTITCQSSTIHLGRLLGGRMNSREAAEIRRNRKSGLISRHDKRPVESRDCTVVHLYNSYLVAYPVDSGEEQAVSIGKPVAPGGTAAEAGCHVARSAIRNREYAYISGPAPRVAPLAEDVG